MVCSSSFFCCATRFVPSRAFVLCLIKLSFSLAYCACFRCCTIVFLYLVTNPFVLIRFLGMSIFVFQPSLCHVSLLCTAKRYCILVSEYFSLVISMCLLFCCFLCRHFCFLLVILMDMHRYLLALVGLQTLSKEMNG